MVMSLLFKWSPRPFHGWRRAILRLFGADLPHPVHVWRTARIEFPWNLKMGRLATLAEGTWIYNLDLIEIGAFATVSQRAFLCTGTHDYTLPDMPLVTKPIRIGEGAWVGADVFVGPGVTIGKGAVVAARSVVVKDLPELMVCAGHPCKPLKPRFPASEDPAPSTPS
jgi:putative colanic acid biosynthesis acetyltransferase WcaF